MEIKELIKEAHENAVKHGFWEEWHKLQEVQYVREVDYQYEEKIAIGNWLMLIVSELGEAQEGLRHNDVDNFKEELADVAIRLADLCGGLNIDLEAAIQKKMAVNVKRPYKHGKAF